MTGEKSNKRPPVPSPAEWGHRVAAESAPWSESVWRRACATWGMKINQGKAESDD